MFHETIEQLVPYILNSDKKNADLCGPEIAHDSLLVAKKYNVRTIPDCFALPNSTFMAFEI